MFQENQIKEIVQSRVELLKKAETKKKGRDTVLPEYTEVYRESVEHFERIANHSETDRFPDKLFLKRAPNQTEEEFEYLKSTFKKPTTFPIWTRFKSAINRIWNYQNWSIKWSNNVPLNATKETPQDYLEKEYPIYRSLENYFKSIATSRKEEDANGVICHKPYYLPTKITENNELVLDQTERIKPIACIYPSYQLVGYLPGVYALILLNEKSEVLSGNSKVREGLVYEFYDDSNIWKIVQVGRKNDYNFEFYIYYSHDLGYLPVDKLKGIPIQRETEVLYQSHFFGAVDALDEIVLDESYLRASKAGQAFPHKWEWVSECDFHNEHGDCMAGKIQIDRGDGLITIDCPNCHGTGKAKSSGPNGVYQIPLPNRNDDSTKGVQMPPFGWEAPDPAILEFLRKEIDKNEEKALSILNLNVSNSDVKGSETALGKKIDREEQFSFIQSISDQVFDLFEFSIKCILQMRYGKEVELPLINPPKNFTIRSEQELTEEIAKAKEAGVPDIAIRNIMLEYLITRFNTQEETTKVIDLVFYADRLISLSNLDISSKKLSGSVANWEDILHTSIYNFIAEAVNEDEKFFEKALEEQKAVLITKAKAKDSEIAPKKMNPDTILANANGGGFKG